MSDRAHEPETVERMMGAAGKGNQQPRAMDEQGSIGKQFTGTDILLAHLSLLSTLVPPRINVRELTCWQSKEPSEAWPRRSGAH